MDCVDQTSTHVPCEWRRQNYDEYEEDGFWDQKMLLGIVKGPETQLRYYGGPPLVSSNLMNSFDSLLESVWQE